MHRFGWQATVSSAYNYFSNSCKIKISVVSFCMWNAVVYAPHTTARLTALVKQTRIHVSWFETLCSRVCGQFVCWVSFSSDLPSSQIVGSRCSRLSQRLSVAAQKTTWEMMSMRARKAAAARRTKDVKAAGELRPLDVAANAAPFVRHTRIQVSKWAMSFGWK